MDSQHILARLRDSEQILRQRGVVHAALFGSRARQTSGPHSDTDVLIEIDPNAGLSVYDYVGLKEYIAGLFDGPVDVVSRENLKPAIRPGAITDAIYAF